jgi:hypothetical protein
MLREASAIGVVLLLSACQANPKQTVLNLDTTDPRWTSRACVHARKAVADYDDGERLRGFLGFADYAVPFAGTAASLLMSWRKDPVRAELNQRVQATCISRPPAPIGRYAVAAPYSSRPSPPPPRRYRR